MAFTLRDTQKEIMAYQQGKMGIAAVPGSGKTWTLSYLAAEIIARGDLFDDQEILVVTLVNSAVNNFYFRVGEFMKERKLIPNLGYRVRTLHGLAHDIVRERPGLVGLSDDFIIVDEREAEMIRKDVVQTWLSSHPLELLDYLTAEIAEGSQNDWVFKKHLPDLLQNICLSYIRSAKNQQLVPERLRQRLNESPLPMPLAEMGYEMYVDYQRALSYRGGIDFDDLIRYALLALECDGEYLERLRYRWPYILEDEAQDSSYLQEQILTLLVGEEGNWVRVGDPNQAIFETFTTADPKFLRDFIKRSDVIERELPVSGRSTKSIIDLANYLVFWTMNEHPVNAVKDALHAPPYIELTERDDPQPNPPDELSKIYFAVGKKYTPQSEVNLVANSLQNLFSKMKKSDGGGLKEMTIAVLVPRNDRGFEVVDELKKRNIPCNDSLLRSSSSTRYSARMLTHLLNYLAEPQSLMKLAQVYLDWRKVEDADQDEKTAINAVAEMIRKVHRAEDYISPQAGCDWLDQLSDEGVHEIAIESLAEFRVFVRRWQAAVELPIDQLVLTLAQDLFKDAIELAISHKLALLLRQVSEFNPTWKLPELKQELDVIAKNERRYIGFSEEDSGFNPDDFKGEVIVSTMHRAKGLEWDRVYLMSVNDYNFPSGMEYDQYISEKWFVRDKLNIPAEALEQLKAVLSADEYKWYEEGKASQEARLGYVRERLRLLYVGITRAKRELIITWNTGRHGNSKPAMPLLALYEYWLDRDQEKVQTNEIS
jgi:DNA helicase-2/ATP-dependent DNA helicase PcrA